MISESRKSQRKSNGLKRSRTVTNRRIAYGVDLGATTINAGLVDESGRILWRSSIPTKPRRGPEAILDDVTQSMMSTKEDLNISHQQAAGVGLGMPGLVDSEKGVAGLTVHLPGWEGFQVSDYLKSTLGIEARIDHDLRAVTRGEMLFGAAKGLRNFALATVGTGIGVCIVIEGRIYRRCTCDMGHMTIDYK